jgi:hypothetical protein
MAPVPGVRRYSMIRKSGSRFSEKIMLIYSVKMPNITQAMVMTNDAPNRIGIENFW